MIELNDLIEIIYKAGEKVMEIYQSSDFEIKYKNDDSPLTIADQVSNDIICNSLHTLYPQIPILSEEGAEIPFSKRKKWQSLWVIDPIDGTKEFIKKNGEFTLNIALIEKNNPTVGLVYAPCIKKLWYGSDQGSFKVSKGKKSKISINSKCNDDLINIVSSRSHSNPMVKTFLNQFKNYNIVNMGSSIKICLVADGTADIYPRLAPTMEWDTAAAHAVLKYAGGSLIDLDTKKEMIYNRKNLKNSNFVANSNLTFRRMI